MFGLFELITWFAPYNFQIGTREYEYVRLCALQQLLAWMCANTGIGWQSLHMASVNIAMATEIQLHCELRIVTFVNATHYAPLLSISVYPCLCFFFFKLLNSYHSIVVANALQCCIFMWAHSTHHMLADCVRTRLFSCDWLNSERKGSERENGLHHIFSCAKTINDEYFECKGYRTRRAILAHSTYFAHFMHWHFARFFWSFQSEMHIKWW